MALLSEPSVKHRLEIQNKHLFSKEELLTYDSVKDWFAGQKTTSQATIENESYGLRVFLSWCNLNPDELRDSRIRDSQSPDFIVRRNWENKLNRFNAKYPNKNTALNSWRAVMSFFKYQGAPLVGIKTPNQNELTVRGRDYVPSLEEIRRLCDLADLRDSLIPLIGSETGMRVGSLVELKLKECG